ncbi:hypothetical protein BDV27DRAFT_142868 [Aspergillus caelatus]|uniref:Cyanovirin-N domain-containing protein n=1 Tax=Aspergillus caelatus TaxID=61420 RepID=A0A5N7ACE7_9EURO|nr:uncharacterized protein BDV27DRAFT_142868 [Aspergillus caelatus]KAE8367343.1 hypothetical protein BDV27DRAFT_142868 [Aspergillus caelatus]
MHQVLTLLLATYLVVLATSQTTTPENAPTNADPGVVLPRSVFQILPKRASPKKIPPKVSPLQNECKDIKIKAGPSVSKGHPEQQLLTASCHIPGTDKSQYSELSLDRCLGWHKNNDGSGRLFAIKHGGGLSKAGGECSTCRYLNSNPNMLCYCANVRDDEKTYVNPATASWTGPVFYNLCKWSV